MMRTACFAMAAAAALSGPAAAQSTKERVTALEQAVSELRASSPAALGVNQRIDQLEAEVRRMTGELEQLSYRLQQANARVEAMSAALSGGATVDPSAASPAPGPGGAASGAPSDLIANTIKNADAPALAEFPADPDGAFAYASELLRGGDYARAGDAFSRFVKTWPNNPRTADARFRLGEIYLATGRNAEAADAFIAHLRNHPSDARSADAHLKLGTAFSRLNQPAEACKVFKTMKTKFPAAAPAVLQRADVEMARINCK